MCLGLVSTGPVTALDLGIFPDGLLAGLAGVLAGLAGTLAGLAGILVEFVALVGALYMLQALGI